MKRHSPAVFAFADGVVFSGEAMGFQGMAAGEAVFNTAMSGYQEIISDPSYSSQIVCFTHPHIGNTGATPVDDESPRAHTAGVVARQITKGHSNWRARQTLDEYLQDLQIPAISGVDTRAVTCKLRDGGAIGACIAPGDSLEDRQRAVDAAKAFGGLAGAFLAQEAGARNAEEWRAGLWEYRTDSHPIRSGERRVTVLDCGVKTAILRQLADRDCFVRVVPYDSDLSEVMRDGADGVVFSNGPGDPQPCEAAAQLARDLMNRKVPLLGICLGHQIIGASLGAKTIKMKFGHHGANHPVREEASGRVIITSQNHGFAVDAASLPPGARATYISLFDGTLQGLESDDPPALTFQGHPEASPGPHDAANLFDKFVHMMDSRRAQ